MKLVRDYLRGLYQDTVRGWNRFWFSPTDPATLCLIRLLGGFMLLYTHLVWTLDLEGFFGSEGRLPVEYVRAFHGNPYAWSYFYWINSPTALWISHVLALLVFAMLAAGLFSRITSVLAFLITVSYAHRVPGALFGLDQINGMLAMYLMIGPSGAAYSLDRLLVRGRSRPVLRESISANIAIRLIQLHMCIIYLFAGIGKLQGESWWDGTAIWGAVANYEYQSMDMTWLAGWPILINVLTHVTVAWEVSYCVLVWPRWTRPLVLALAVPLHAGIALFLGMITFGLAMLIGNVAFVSPALVRRVPGFGSNPRATPARPRR